MEKKSISILFSLIALLAVIPLRAEFVYFGINNSTLVGYRVEPSGLWQSVPEPPIPVSSLDLFSLRSSADSRVLYLNLVDGPIVGYTIDQNGLLTAIPGLSQTPGGKMVIDPKGRFVYAIGWPDLFESNEYVFCYRTGANGTLVPIPNSTVSLTEYPVAGAIDPSGSYFYLTTDAPALYAYRIEQDGTLSAISNVGLQYADLPHVVAVDHSGKYVYVAGNVLYSFQLDQAGQLKPAPGSPRKLGGWIDGLRINPKASFLYALAGGRIFGFEILSTGNLRSVRGTPRSIDQDRQVRGEAKIDRSGKFLYVSDLDKNEIDAFKLGSAGDLTPISGSPFSVGQAPGQFIFAGSIDGL